jgi:hypothetical protein
VIQFIGENESGKPNWHLDKINDPIYSGKKTKKNHPNPLFDLTLLFGIPSNLLL